MSATHLVTPASPVLAQLVDDNNSDAGDKSDNNLDAGDKSDKNSDAGDNTAGTEADGGQFNASAAS